ncbi:hypothetical protein CN160_34870 [Sinorhizobium meliloti]|nr:hypothetical protein CN160_34870 [Sinorhizobium meliloti]
MCPNNRNSLNNKGSKMAALRSECRPPQKGPRHPLQPRRSASSPKPAPSVQESQGSGDATLTHSRKKPSSGAFGVNFQMSFTYSRR